MQGQPDQILISKLVLSTQIGATEREREKPQRMLATITLEPTAGFAELNDDLARTVDYDAAAQAARTLAANGARVLVETLAEDLATMLLLRFPISAVEVELHKFILPDTEFVGVRIRRER
jgi:7,8-dihydroneopterin aldolase/epimerase/oxygenase